MDLSALKGFEWDIGNIAKVQKRLDLATVEFAFQGDPYVAFDALHSQAEKRWLLVNRISERYVFLIFTVRGDRIRVVSARFMRKREAKRYEKFFQKH